MVLSFTRELIGVGDGIGAGCQPCLGFHARTPSAPKRSGQRSALGCQSLDIGAELPADCCDTSGRAKELLAIGAAVASNSRANHEKHITAAELVGVSAREPDEAVGLWRAA